MKKFFITASIISILLLVCIISLPFFIDANDYKKQILATLKDSTGYDIRIDGKIGLSVIPSLEFVVEDVAINDPDDNQKKIVSVEKLFINIRLIPLLSGKIKIDSFAIDNPVITLESTENGESNWKKNNKVAEGSLPDIKSDSSIESGASVLAGFAGLELDSFEVSNGTLTYNDLAKKQSLSVQEINIKTELKSEKNNFRVSGKIDTKMRDKGVFDIKGFFTIDGNKKYTLGNVVLKFDDIKADVNADIDFNDIIPVVNASADINQPVNLDYYLKRDGDSDIGTSDNSATLAGDSNKVVPHVWSDSPIDFSFIRETNSNFNLRTAGIIYNEINIGSFEVTNHTNNGKMQCKIKGLNISKGIVNSVININTNAPKTFITVQADITGFDLAELPSSMPSWQKLSGTLNAGVNITLHGNSEKDFINSIAGGFGINVVKGSFKGMDLLAMVKNTASAFNIGKGTIDNATLFDSLTGNFNIANGLISNDNLSLKSQVVNLNGNGIIDLPQYVIDYTISPDKNVKDGDESVLKEIASYVPVKITGSLDNPQFKPDTGGLAKNLLQDPQKTKDLVDKLKNFKREDVLKELKGIFNGF